MSKHTENVTAYREMLIGHAVAARKIAPDRAADYRRMFDANPSGVAHLLTAPVREGGLMAGNAAVHNPIPPGADEYPPEWLPETRGGALRGEVAFEDQQARLDGTSTVLPRTDHRPAAAAPRRESSRVTVGND